MSNHKQLASSRGSTHSRGITHSSCIKVVLILSLGLYLTLAGFSISYVAHHDNHYLQMSYPHYLSSQTNRHQVFSFDKSMFHRLEGALNGFSWKVIDWENPFSADEESMFNCTWTHFQSFLSRKSAPICVFENDLLSYVIKTHRRWSDCDILPIMWNKGRHHGSVSKNDQPVVYVEIGANIGSRVMEMLLSTNATIVAFEPHPRNLYNIKKTVSLLDESYQNRLALFPIGLGNASETSTIYSATGNMGNSIIGQVIRDWDTQVFEELNQFTVNVERLDSILVANKIKIGLVKLDVQGFECKVMEGMGEVAKIIDAMKLEFAYNFLIPHNCLDLVTQLMKNFDVYRQYDDGIFSGLTNDVELNVTEHHVILDLFASKRVSN